MKRAAVIVVAFVCACVGLSAPAGAAVNPWTVAPSPYADGVLLSVSADSATDAWAAGQQAAFLATAPLVEHHTAGGWGIHSSPAIAAPVCATADGSQLDLVKAFGPGDVWVAGHTICTPVPHNAFVSHWNGSSWTTTRLPATVKQVTGLDGTSDTNLWLVGYALNSSQTSSSVAVLHGGKQGWTKVFSDSASFYGQLVAISPTLAYVSGQETPAGSPTAVIAHGGVTAASWTLQRLTAPSLQCNGAITASSATDIWVAGFNDTLQECVLHSNGTRWTANNPPPMPPAHHWLYGIAEHGPSDVWAVGNRGSGFNLFDGWHGSSWVNWGGPNPGGGARSNAIAAIPGTSNGFWAVGVRADSASPDLSAAMILHCAC